MKPLLAALARRPLPHPPIWVMRQAGRYLPEYREIRERFSFLEAVRAPKVAAEITLQPIRRFGMDGAVIFADIMTPLEAMGVEVEFAPGPKLRPHTPSEIAQLPDFDLDRVGYVAETISLVRQAVPDTTAVIGFAGAPTTLLAYLLEGGGSKEFMALRRAVRAEPEATAAAASRLATAMAAYLRMQVDAGAEAVQLFDSWAGVLDRALLESFAIPAARDSLHGVEAPTIYFAPGAGHGLDLFPAVGSTAIGVDWRRPLDEAWAQIGHTTPIQGNLDPAVLLTDPATIRAAVRDVLDRAGGRPGHVFNLGHGIHRTTPPEHVAALVEAVRGNG